MILVPTAAAEDQIPRGAVDNGDGTYSWPAPVEVPADRTMGPLTLTYAGQASIALEPRIAEEVFVRDDASPAKDLVGQLLDLVVVDDGMIWHVTKVDTAGLDPALVEQVEAVNLGLECTTEGSDGTGGILVRDSYSLLDCDPGTAGAEVRLWGDESRVKKTAPFTDRQKGALLLRRPDGATCSAMLLRPWYAITAAHCLLDDDGNLLADPDLVEFYDIDGSMIKGDFFAYGPGYLPNTPWDEDWAVMKLTSAFTWLPDVHDLYGGSDAAYDDIDANVHNLAYPGFTWDSPICVLNDNGTTLLGGLELYHQSNAEVSAIQNKGLKYKSDSGPSASGSAYYFCPDGDDAVCAQDDEGRIIGVHSGWRTDGITGRHVGPKSTYFSSVAITFMNNN